MDKIRPQHRLDFEHCIRTCNNSGRFRIRREGKGKGGKSDEILCVKSYYMMFQRIFLTAAKSCSSWVITIIHATPVLRTVTACEL